MIYNGLKGILRKMEIWREKEGGSVVKSRNGTSHKFMSKGYFFTVASQPVPSLMAAIAFLTSNLESVLNVTSLVLELA